MGKARKLVGKNNYIWHLSLPMLTSFLPLLLSTRFKKELFISCFDINLINDAGDRMSKLLDVFHGYIMSSMCTNTQVRSATKSFLCYTCAAFEFLLGTKE